MSRRIRQNWTPLTDGQLRQRVRARIESGILPAKHPSAQWAGPGVGKPCVVCDRATHWDEIEHELDFGDGTPRTFHRACMDAWEAERADG